MRLQQQVLTLYGKNTMRARLLKSASRSIGDSVHEAGKRLRLGNQPYKEGVEKMKFSPPYGVYTPWATFPPALTDGAYRPRKTTRPGEGRVG